MLPSQLLRVRTRKGVISPLYCFAKNGDLQLAEDLINQFEVSRANKERKELLDKRLSMIECRFNDYKLVRGLCTLLERRCRFVDVSGGNDDHNIPPPTFIRKALFEESSKIGLALTDVERNKIMDVVASRMKLTVSQISEIMWADLEGNLILDDFNSISAPDLLGWYNLSLIQTLLFSCTRLEFTVYEGVNWKRVLRDVKRLGLMYNLQREQKDAAKPISFDPLHDAAHTKLVCSVDGPISLFKLTDRYGTSIAKLLPSIISSQRWSLSAWIVRKTMSGKKIYEFKTTSSDIPTLLNDPYKNTYPLKFDSSVEEKFANKFEQSANGWKLVREPEPLVVSDGRAFIPDFMFQKYDKKVYLEIVGFWTKEYLERKLHKLNDIVSSKSIDLFIAVNEDLACAKILRTNFQDRIISYKNELVPVKILLNHLKTIDQQQIERDTMNPNLKIELNGAQDIISIKDIATRLGISTESVIAIAARDYQDYLRAGLFLVSKSKGDKLTFLLNGVIKFVDACTILSDNSIPEEGYAELISNLGYDVLWQDLDPNNAIIVRRR
ncbi:MAG: DUF790 family protein [Nitrososphaeraceae archaeon]